MNRLTIFLLAGVAVLLSGVASRRSFDLAAPVSPSFEKPAAAPTQPPAVMPAPAGARLLPPAAANARPVQQKTANTKISKPVKPAHRVASGETPDDYVYVKPGSDGLRSAAVRRAEPRTAAATASVRLIGSPARNAAFAPTPNYARAVAEAETLAGDDLTRAARRLELITAQDPARPEAYEKLAAIRLQLGDYYQAYEMYASAVRNGGKASFAVTHDHTRGSFDSKPSDTCAGKLSILPDKLTFESGEHTFAVSWAELLEAASNRFFGSGIGGFHVKVGASKKSRNFNLAPQSKDKRETNIILDLLIENAEGK